MRSSHRWRAVLAVTAAAAVLAMAGCGDAGRRDTAPTDSNAAASDKPRLAIVYYPQFRDGSWGEAALTGAQKLKDAGAIADFAVQENVNPGADGVRALRSFAERGLQPDHRPLVQLRRRREAGRRRLPGHDLRLRRRLR